MNEAFNKQRYYYGITPGFPGDWIHIATFPSLVPNGVADPLVLSSSPGFQRIYRGLYNHTTHQYESWTRIA